MGKTLHNLIESYLTLKGTAAYDLLGKKVGKSPKTIRRWINGGLPSQNAAFRLAKALGCDTDEALRVAKEPFESVGKLPDAPLQDST